MQETITTPLVHVYYTSELEASSETLVFNLVFCGSGLVSLLTFLLCYWRRQHLCLKPFMLCEVPTHAHGDGG